VAAKINVDVMQSARSVYQFQPIDLQHSQAG